MRVGVSLSSTSHDPDTRRAARHVLAMVTHARDAGLDTLSFGDNHGRSPMHYFQNTPTLGRALAAWDPQRPAGCLFLLPMWPPMLVAEQVGTLAAFHEGRFVVQTGLGSRAQYAQLGVDVAHRGAALDESIRVIKTLFDGDAVSSDMFGLDDVRLGLVPPDGVEWWIGANGDDGLRRAARLGATWYAPHAPTGQRLAEMIATYRSRCEDFGTEPTVALRREALVLANGDEARTRMARRLTEGHRGLTADMVLCGDECDVAAQLAGLADLGVDEVVCRTMALDDASDLETLDRLGAARTLL